MKLDKSPNVYFSWFMLLTRAKLALTAVLTISIRQNSSVVMAATTYSVIEKGKLYSESYRLFFRNNETNSLVSPFHDISMKPDTESPDVFNMVVEVPRWTNAKMEISKSAPLNPIMQDVKKGKPRFVGNVFPHRGYIWNYGAIPQTWEDPNIKDASTEAGGDNDPIDVCDISGIITPMGSVIQVKVLGILAMLDEGETDWKVMAINTADPLAQHLNDVKDIEAYKPGLLHATIEWFKYYKVPDGKPTNKFAFKNLFKDKQFALEVIESTHEHWKALVNNNGEIETAIQLKNTLVTDSPHLITNEVAQEILDECENEDPEPAEIPASVNEVFYINGTPIPEPVKEAVDAAGDVVVNGEAESGEMEVDQNGTAEEGETEGEAKEGSQEESKEEEGSQDQEMKDETPEEKKEEKEEGAEENGVKDEEKTEESQQPDADAEPTQEEAKGETTEAPKEDEEPKNETQ